MYVFVIGASGYIGSAVVEPLQAAGHTVSGLARNDASAARLIAACVRPVPGDLADPPCVAAGALAAGGV